MKNKFCYNRQQPAPAISWRIFLLAVWIAGCALIYVPRAAAGGDAPAWMHSAPAAPLPVYDEKTDAVLLYSETSVTVLSADKIRTQVPRAYKILRPNGRERGMVAINFNPQRKIRTLHAWCIPAQGKDYEVKDKDAVDQALRGDELVDDVKFRVLQIPAADPGNIVGYEYEVEEQPFYLQDMWYFQGADPVREGHYSLQLPASWEFKVSWLNHPEITAVDGGSNLWRWTVKDVEGIREEEDMPPVRGVQGQMIVTFFSPGGQARNGFAAWNDMGKWYGNLVSGRVPASPEIKQEVATLTASKTTQLQKMQALAQFVQHDIRYVAIELGIGGFQPHAASEVFSHRYGDCKDKATLMRSMLQEIGVESYFVVINGQRGVITRDMPAHDGFNHVITAIKLPDGVVSTSLVATMQHPKLGKILFFDPTDDLMPFGQIRGELQDNYALFVTPDGGELVELPQQPAAMNSIQRTATLTLDPSGTLHGDVKEVRLGDRATSERGRLRTVSNDQDRIKPIESLLARSLSNFRITEATLINLSFADQPFGFNYSFEAERYAKDAGGLLLLRPRVLGVQAQGLLEKKEPRKFPIEFDGPVRDTDKFEITIPPGYEVDDLPPPVDADYSFASYHSKTEVKGNVIGYTRTFEVKETQRTGGQS